MSDLPSNGGPIIRWDDHGSDGWVPNRFATVRDALEDTRYVTRFVITRVVEYEVIEKEEPL